jgi:hypothetical protein
MKENHMKKSVETADTVDVLREFVTDLEAAYPDVESLKDLAEEWPDLVDTFEHAVMALRKHDRQRCGARNSFKIHKYLASGEASGEARNYNDLLEELGNLLDHACSHDIFGDVLFEGEDGKVYVASVEGCIMEANPDYVKEILAER